MIGCSVLYLLDGQSVFVSQLCSGFMMDRTIRGWGVVQGIGVGDCTRVCI